LRLLRQKLIDKVFVRLRRSLMAEFRAQQDGLQGRDPEQETWFPRRGARAERTGGVPSLTLHEQVFDGQGSPRIDATDEYRLSGTGLVARSSTGERRP